MKYKFVFTVLAVTLLSFSCASKKKSIAFLEAVKQVDIKKIDKLIKNNIDINIKDKQGYTPLFYAVNIAIQREQQLDAFIKRTNPLIEKMQPKIKAIKEQDIIIEEGKYLLKIKSTERPFITNKSGKLYQQYDAQIQELRKVHNFLASVHNKCEKKSPVYDIYAELPYRDKIKFIAYLVDKQFVHNHEEFKKLERDYIDAETIIKLLLKHDADPNKKCNSLSIAEFAKKKGSEKVFEILKKG